MRDKGENEPGQQVELRPVSPGRLDEAADLLALAMRDNPLHYRVFGADPLRRQARLRRLMILLLGHVAARGQIMGAWRGGQLVGVLGLMAPAGCRPDFRQGTGFARQVLLTQSPLTTLRIARWLSAWTRHDPNFPHWHFGPLGVRPEFRRQGIARRLMTEACMRLDEGDGPSIGWLETDLMDNVRFYQSLGFTIVHQRRLLGVETWFMIRRPQPVSGA